MAESLLGNPALSLSHAYAFVDISTAIQCQRWGSGLNVALAWLCGFLYSWETRLTMPMSSACSQKLALLLPNYLTFGAHVFKAPFLLLPPELWALSLLCGSPSICKVASWLSMKQETYSWYYLSKVWFKKNKLILFTEDLCDKKKGKKK